MKEELNIAAILQDKPQETKLWSPIYGNCKFLSIVGKTRPIQVTSKSGTHYFRENARYNEYEEICLFPSKQMQDWSKFAWKKGDVLADEERFVIFKGFENDDYTEFFAPFEYNNNNTFRQDLGLITNEFRKVNDDIAQEVIKKIEEHYGGKLNLDTLEIEKQPEFKEGDIVVAEGDNLEKKIFIFRYKMRDSYSDERIYKSHITINPDGSLFHKLMFYLREDVTYRLATDSEKQQLFLALEKEGKRWNPDTKQIEDLPKKCEFKPFDKVLVRDSQDDMWMPNFFSCYNRSKTDEYKYGCIAGNCDCVIYSKYCIPYNEETKHFLGTTDEWKGGEA